MGWKHDKAMEYSERATIRLKVHGGEDHVDVMAIRTIVGSSMQSKRQI